MNWQNSCQQNGPTNCDAVCVCGAFFIFFSWFLWYYFCLFFFFKHCVLIICQALVHKFSAHGSHAHVTMSTIYGKKHASQIVSSYCTLPTAKCTQHKQRGTYIFNEIQKTNTKTVNKKKNKVNQIKWSLPQRSYILSGARTANFRWHPTNGNSTLLRANREN